MAVLKSNGTTSRSSELSLWSASFFIAGKLAIILCESSESTLLRLSLKMLNVDGLTSYPFMSLVLYFEKSSCEISSQSLLVLGPLRILFFQRFCSIYSKFFGGCFTTNGLRLKVSSDCTKAVFGLSFFASFWIGFASLGFAIELRFSLPIWLDFSGLSTGFWGVGFTIRSLLPW